MSDHLGQHGDWWKSAFAPPDVIEDELRKLMPAEVTDEMADTAYHAFVKAMEATGTTRAAIRAALEAVIGSTRHSARWEPPDPGKLPPWERVDAIKAAGKLMNPGGGSLETTLACRTLHLICLSQQYEIDYLRDRLTALENHLRGGIDG